MSSSAHRIISSRLAAGASQRPGARAEREEVQRVDAQLHAGPEIERADQHGAHDHESQSRGGDRWSIRLISQGMS
jgi:hypothetical protein